MIPKFTQDGDQKYYRSIADVFSATVVSAADDAGQWIVQPHVIELNGDDAPEMPALAGDAIKPAIGNTVLCVTSRNNFDHVLQNRANRATGANPIIVAVFAAELTRDAILNITKTLNVGGDFNLTGNANVGGNLTADGTGEIKGAATLGTGAYHMVLGENAGLWAAGVDAALAALYVWASTQVAGIPQFPLTPPLVPWLPTNLSQKHKLD